MIRCSQSTMNDNAGGSDASPDFMSLTLNDLRFLEAVVRTRSLSQAAAAAGLSRSAASRVLGRLRDVLGSPIVIRSHPHFVPTAAGLRYAAVAASILERTVGLAAPAEFDPARLERRFRIGAGENAAFAFCSPVVEKLFAVAPGVRFVIEPFDREQVFTRLQNGSLDLAFLPFVPIPEAFRSADVARNNIVTLVRKGHPLLALAKERPLTIADTRAWRRIAVSAAVTNLPNPSADADVLRFYRNANDEPAVSCPYFLTALSIIERTDALLSVAKQTALEAAEFSDKFQILPIPSQLEDDYNVRIIWHERLDDDPAAHWLLGVFKSVLAAK